MLCFIVGSRQGDCLLSGRWRWRHSPETCHHGGRGAVGDPLHCGRGTLAKRWGALGVDVLLLVLGSLLLLLMLLLAPAWWGACWRRTSLRRRTSPLLLLLLVLLVLLGMLRSPVGLGGRRPCSGWWTSRGWWRITLLLLLLLSVPWLSGGFWRWRTL